MRSAFPGTVRGVEKATRSASVSCLLTLVIGCSAEPGSNLEPFVTTDSTGVEVVLSTLPLWGDSAAVIAPDPLLELGSEEDGPELFGFVWQGILLSQDRFAVVDLSAMEVRLFDSGGEHLRTFGAAGLGPGEFGSIAGLFAFRGDSIVVDDQRLRRATIFSLGSGGFRTVPNQMEGNFAAFGADAGGRLYYYNPGRGYRPDLEPGLQWDTTDVVSADPDSGSPTVLTRLASRQQSVLPDGNTEVVIPAFYSIHATSRDGFYWGTADRYEIAHYGPTGALRRLMRRPIEPTAVTPEMIQAYVDLNLDRVRRTEGESAVPRYRRIYEEGVYNDRAPLFSTAFVDRTDRLWVAHADWPSTASPEAWSVFSPEGAWLGDVDAPSGVMVLDATADMVLGVWRDELDVPHVRLHALSR